MYKFCQSTFLIFLLTTADFKLSKYEESFYYSDVLNAEYFITHARFETKIRCLLLCSKIDSCETVAFRRPGNCLLYKEKIPLPGTGTPISDYKKSGKENKFVVISKSRSRCTDWVDWQTDESRENIWKERFCINLKGFDTDCKAFCKHVLNYTKDGYETREFSDGVDYCEKKGMNLPKDLDTLMTNEVRAFLGNKEIFTDFKQHTLSNIFQSQTDKSLMLDTEENLWWNVVRLHIGRCVKASQRELSRALCSRPLSSKLSIVCENFLVFNVDA